MTEPMNRADFGLIDRLFKICTLCVDTRTNVKPEFVGQWLDKMMQFRSCEYSIFLQLQDHD